MRTIFNKQKKLLQQLSIVLTIVTWIIYSKFHFAEVKSASDKPFHDRKIQQQWKNPLTFTKFLMFSSFPSLQASCPILWISVIKCEENIKNFFLEQNWRGYWSYSSSCEEVEMFWSLPYVPQTRTGQSNILRRVWERQGGYKTGWVHTDNKHIKELRISRSIFIGSLRIFIKRILHVFNSVLRFLFSRTCWRFVLLYRVRFSDCRKNGRR